MTTAVAQVPSARVAPAPAKAQGAGTAAPATAGATVERTGASPLSVEHLRQLDDARSRATKVRRCAAVATFDGWSVGAFGALTVACGLFSAWGWILGVGMLAAAWVELRTVERIRALDAAAARRLGWNQVALALLLLTYAGCSLYNALCGPDPLAATITAAPEVAELLAPYSRVARMISAAVYAGVALVAILAQGGTALYYFTREKHVRAYREQTPPWILELQRAGAAL